MDFAVKTLAEFLANEGEHFTDGWQAYDANTEINIWTEDSQDFDDPEESDTTIYHVTSYWWNTEINQVETHNFTPIGNITVKKGNS